MRRLVAVLIALLVSACTAPIVQTDVTRFSVADASAPRSFTILPEGQQRGSLEFEAYADRVADALAAQGWKPVPSGSAARPDAVVFLAWGVGPANTVTWQSPSAVYGGYGWGGPRYWYGGGYFPFYEPFPYWETRSVTTWPKWLTIDILDHAAWKRGETRKIFEGRATTARGGRDIQPVMPYLVQALFTGFPGASGRTIRVDVPVPETAQAPASGY